MASFETSTHIAAPPRRVYDLVTDLRGAPDRISGITSLEVLTEGEFGVGTRFRETRVMFGKEATEEMEVTELQPGEGYTLEAESCGCKFRSVVRVRPEGSGSTLLMSCNAMPQSMMAKVMSVVMGPLMKKATVKALNQDLADIKAAAEGGQAQ